MWITGSILNKYSNIEDKFYPTDEQIKFVNKDVVFTKDLVGTVFYIKFTTLVTVQSQLVKNFDEDYQQKVEEGFDTCCRLINKMNGLALIKEVEQPYYKHFSPDELACRMQFFIKFKLADWNVQQKLNSEALQLLSVDDSILVNDKMKDVTEIKEIFQLN